MAGDDSDIVDELRELIVAAAPDPDQAAPVRQVGADEPLDGVIPFSSVIVLGVVVAVEDRWDVRVTKDTLARAAVGGVSLRTLARMVHELRGALPA
jgi:hypothetical protein